MSIIDGFSEVDAAWIAGFFDGEGSVTGSNIRGDQSALMINLSQSDVTQLVRIESIFGGFIVMRRGGFSNSLVHQWFLCGRKAKPFLEAIRPYIRIKKEQMDLALQFISLMDGPSSTKRLRKMERRKLIYRIQRCNHKRRLSLDDLDWS